MTVTNRGTTEDATIVQDLPDTNDNGLALTWAGDIGGVKDKATDCIMQWYSADIEPANLTSAVLNIYVDQLGLITTGGLDVLLGTFDETTVTWNTAPAASTGKEIGPFIALGWNQIDITDLLQDIDTDTYGVRITPTAPKDGDNRVVLRSKESGTDGPFLAIDGQLNNYYVTVTGNDANSGRA